jgi:hypothetical protein
MPRWFRSGQPGAEIPLPRFLARLGLELLVVFIGVYAAFALSEHEDRRDDAVRRVQLQAALVREIEALTMNTRRVAETLPERLAQFDAAVAAGARPPLSPLIEAVRVDTHMWEAALQSSALDLFAVDTVYDLSRFYNELNAGFEQLAQLRALSETVLIPNLGLDSDEFYDADHRLRPKYGWYRAGLGQLQFLSSNITTLGDSLVVALTPGEGSEEPR